VVVIAFDHISKSFPGVKALDDVSFEVRAGECHALLGENGAGKSTLGKLLAGIYEPDSGRLLIGGREERFRSCRDAARAGVAIVHQELAFCPNLSIAENLCLHDLPRRNMLLDRPAMRRRAAGLLRQIGLEIDVNRPIGSLSTSQEQMVQIAAAIGLLARVLVFDEPTSSLGRAETARLFELIRRLQREGATILYVSHRLEEIFELCQSVTVLRDGAHVTTQPLAQVTRDDLVRMMVGRAVEAAPRLRASSEMGVPRLVVRDFSSPGKFSNVCLTLHAGEIVGLAGLVGAGRTELAQALYGLDPRATGQVSVDGRDVRVSSPAQAQQLGLGLIPEDRKVQGLVPEMSVRENMTLPVLDRFKRWMGWADRRAESSLARRCIEELSIRTPSAETRVASLSGGNQQKVLFARGLAAECKVLIIDEPTRGVDVGAKREIHDSILAWALRGVAILLISSDMPELLALAQRVIVLREGQVVAELAQADADAESVLRHMTGLVVV
jgi:ABC-type sugar transport system ATPase subunit